MNGRLPALVVGAIMLAACSGAAVTMPPPPAEKDGMRLVERARRLAAEGDLDRAGDAARRASQLGRSANLVGLWLDAAIIEAQIEYRRGGTARATASLKELLPLARRSSPRHVPYILYDLAVLAWESGDKAGAQASLAEAQSAGSLPDTLAASVANLDALIAYGDGRFGDAAGKAERARSLAVTAGDPSQASLACKLLARNAVREGRRSDALVLYRDALGYDRSAGDTAGIAAMLRELGALSAASGDKAAAFDWYYQGFELASARGLDAERAFFLEKATELLQ